MRGNPLRVPSGPWELALPALTQAETQSIEAHALVHATSNFMGTS